MDFNQQTDAISARLSIISQYNRNAKNTVNDY